MSEFDELTSAIGLDELVQVERFLEKGGDVNYQGRTGETALHHACFGGNIHIVKLLIERGALLNIEDDFGRTPMHFAIQQNHKQIQLFLQDDDVKREASIKQTLKQLNVQLEEFYDIGFRYRIVYSDETTKFMPLVLKIVEM